MISPDLTEPRRMRLLLGWCGDRALLAKPQAPSSSSKKASEEFQALQAGEYLTLVVLSDTNPCQRVSYRKSLRKSSAPMQR